MEITLKVKRAVVLLTSGTDQVTLELEDTLTPYPEMDAASPGKYPAFVQINARAGYGAEWCRKVFGMEAEVIDTVPSIPGVRGPSRRRDIAGPPQSV